MNSRGGMFGRAATRGIVLGGFTSGMIDLVYGSVQAAVKDSSILQPWKGVASGLLGAAAREGGAGMALIGVLLHFIICFGAAVVFYLLVRRMSWALERPLISGALLGFGFLLAMNYAILPLSQIGRPIYVGEGFLAAILGHIVMIGIPIAHFVTRGVRDARHA